MAFPYNDKFPEKNFRAYLSKVWLRWLHDICLATAWPCAIACDSRDEKKLELFHPKGRPIKLMIEMELRGFSSKIKAFSPKLKRRVRHLMGRVYRYRCNIKGKTLAHPGSFSKYFDWGKKNLRLRRSKFSFFAVENLPTFYDGIRTQMKYIPIKYSLKKLEGKRPFWRYQFYIRE
jgi:hypothetical protein